MSYSAPRAESYVDHVARLEERLSTDAALRQAVGGEFLAIGQLEYQLLRSRGLQDHHLVVDVGCGSGRLAYQLAPFPGIRYIGCDVVPRLLEYASELCQRPDWSFVPTNGSKIPCADGAADVICFFSVFTHLHQEEIYRYLREAFRVLKPGALLVMSFLEFRVPSHWAAFIASVEGTRDDQHLNQFIDRESLQVWATRTGFNVLGIFGGDTDYIPLPAEVKYESGAKASGMASLGQSVAILQKRDPGRLEAAPGIEPIVKAPTSTTNSGQSSDRPLPSSPAGDPLVNVSARAFISAGGAVTAGFSVGGTAPRRLLVRAIGPSLRLFGQPNPLANPILQLMRGEILQAECSGGWKGEPFLAAAAAAVGAFALPAENNDAVLVATLPPGGYTAIVRGKTSSEQGEVLLEVYLID